MVDCQDLNVAIENPVYNPIVAKDDLPDVFLSDLGDHASGFWKSLKSLDALEDLCGKELSIARSIARDELANCINVI